MLVGLFWTQNFVEDRHLIVYYAMVLTVSGGADNR